MKRKVTCRYGIEYSVEIKGTRGVAWRTIDMLSKCCCFVCYNHDCKEPKDEIIPCHNECLLFSKRTFCGKEEKV